ncbi:MAG: DUF4240 domain-containing protein [Ardenticatenaceae bacterium]|nr:DUF4240 domain-containing protein [Ardenticatenaceae bacterium]
MNESKFWEIITMFDWDKTGDDEAVLEPAKNVLISLSNEEIFQFDEILAKKLFLLDTKQHAKNIGVDAYRNEQEYFSPDAFLYARCVVVANGKEFFESIVENPQFFPPDLEFEAILYLAQIAYEEKTGQEYQFTPSINIETFSNETGWR